MTGPQDILDFWFGAPGSPEGAGPRDIWFESNAAFDADCRRNFAALLAHARERALDHWAASPEGALALVLLLDQMPRNIHRGSAEAFAGDATARSVARNAIARGFDRDLPPHRRQFLYLPFEHSEALADQEEALRLFARLPDGTHREQQLDQARRHHAVIARFGRFPHRNAALGRASTAEEEAFLASPAAPY